MMILSDASTCGITHDDHSDDIYATRVINYALGEHL